MLMTQKEQQVAEIVARELELLHWPTSEELAEGIDIRLGGMRSVFDSMTATATSWLQTRMIKNGDQMTGWETVTVIEIKWTWTMDGNTHFKTKQIVTDA